MWRGRELPELPVLAGGLESTRWAGQRWFWGGAQGSLCGWLLWDLVAWGPLWTCCWGKSPLEAQTQKERASGCEWPREGWGQEARAAVCLLVPVEPTRVCGEAPTAVLSCLPLPISSRSVCLAAVSDVTESMRSLWAAGSGVCAAEGASAARRGGVDREQWRGCGRGAGRLHPHATDFSFLLLCCFLEMCLYLEGSLTESKAEERTLHVLVPS